MDNERPSLETLEMRGDFIRRHIGPDAEDIGAMLRTLDVDSIESLMQETIPERIISPHPFNLPSPISERAALDALRFMRERNRVFISMIGLGYYGTILPAVIRRNILENPGWYTAYTPYQAEVSQGRLEALLNFQQMIIDLTGMELANASLLDEATAAAEAMTMLKRVHGDSANTFFVDRNCFPQTIAVVKTRAHSLGIDVVVGDAYAALPDTEVFGILLQYPGANGVVTDLAPLIARCHERKILVAVAADIMALAILKPPGEMDADVVVGNTQRFGVPMGYGGSHAAYFATRDAYKRSVPGRLIGVSKDVHGQPALRMALQTREQHIRREKATSNICTAQVLPAVLASMYAVYHGPEGISRIAMRIHRMSLILAEGLGQLGFTVDHPCFFDTITVHVPNQARRIAARARESRINLHVIDGDHLGISFDETTGRKELQTLWSVFATRANAVLDIDTLDQTVSECIPTALQRQSSYLTHPVFNRYRSETEMLRYIRWLASRDIALDRAMIPLGSCTMKLNATTEMLPIAWRNFANLHPFAPLDQVQGYQQLLEELETWLCEITGFDAFSFQPNAGSQGEYTGLLVIRKYHETRGEGHRNICLIPASAHGTNPASAIMAGLQVVVVACDEDGNVDVADLRNKAQQYHQSLAALMITYPSTHGVFEEAIVEICAIIHEHGGQVYLDGANMNALVGLCRPAEIGADVSHLNLHKTFCIPHGGGGPGMGPIGVRNHLAPFLPDHPLVEGVNPAKHPGGTIGTVSAAPWGSASILVIPWAYIAMMDGQGLKQATQVAILNANYIARRLADHYPILYTGKNQRVAHECIIDLRELKARTGITVDDVAKRFVDYGFHAPTVSFPVADTLMIEPTESESKIELDRFCDALIQIRAEIAEIELQQADRQNNVLKNAPHVPRLLIEDDWKHPYSKGEAFYPLPYIRDNKYWPPVGRVDALYGDKHLVCTCPPIEAYL